MKYNKVTLYWLLVGVLLVLISICSFFIYYFMDIKNTDLSIEKLAINESSKLNYKVKLLDNDYYNMEMNTTNYVTSLVDNINTNFNYTLSFGEEVSGEYSYYIVGKLISSSANSSETLLERELIKTNIKKYKIKGNVINLSSAFDIDLDEYLRIYTAFKNEYNLNITGEVIFDVIINYSVYNENINKYLKREKVLTVTVPLSNTTTSILTTPDEDTTMYEYSELNKDENKIFLIISLEFLGAILLFILIIIALLKTIYSTKSEYQRKLQRILKKYDSLIVHITDLPDLSKSDVLFVSAFKDLVDASHNLVLPINFVEVVKNHEATFIITNDSQAYVYKFTDKD